MTQPSAALISNSEERSRFIRWARVAIVILVLGFCLQALAAILNFEGYYTDGALQLFNPLRRISAGLPFEFFHGKGIPYLHYPIFALFGRSIFASEVARYSISLGAFILSAFALASSAFQRREHRLFFIVALLIYAYINDVNSIATASNSLLGLRSTMPLFAFIVLFIPLRLPLRGLLLGVCFALALFLGSEQQTAFTLSFVMVHGAVAVMLAAQRQWQAVLRQSLFIGLTLLTMAVIVFVGLLLISGGVQGALTTLRYNYAEVSVDQFWYFGVPPNEFAYNIGPFLLPQFSLPVSIALILMISYGARVWKARRDPHLASAQVQSLALIVLLGYGILTTAAYLGYYFAGYLEPLWRIVIFVLCYTLFTRGEFRIPMLHRLTTDYRLQKRMLWFFLVLILLSRPPLGVIKLVAIALDRNRSSLAMLDENWSKYLASTVATIDRTRANPNLTPVIWSTYAGLIQDHYQTFNPADDYIIHALGPTRRDRYLQTFINVKPEYVETIRKLDFRYEEWLQSTSWDFYELVLSNYDAILTTDHSILWQRHNGPWVDLPTECVSIPVADPHRFVFPSVLTSAQADYTLAVIQVQYTVTNPWRWLPLIGGLPRNLVTPQGALSKLPISLPPYRPEARFPIAFRNGQTPSLSFGTFSLLPGASFNVSNVCVRTIPMTAQVHDFVTLDLQSLYPQQKDGPLS